MLKWNEKKPNDITITPENNNIYSSYNWSCRHKSIRHQATQVYLELALLLAYIILIHDNISKREA